MKDNSFDFQLYSREIICYGMSTFKKLLKSKIFIYGMRGLGIEVVKNIILKGPEKITIFDPEIVKIVDLNSNFYLEQEDVGKKRRDEAILNKLKYQNENVEIDYLKDNTLEKLFEILPNNYDILVLTEPISKSLSIKLDEFCREKKIFFIYAAVLGLTCFLFNDFGDKHLILEESDRELQKYNIKNIKKNGDNGFVEIILPDKDIGFGDNDYVKFSLIEGMIELNFENEKKYRKIEYKSPDSFYIGDISNYSDYLGNGIVEEVGIPIEMNHKSLEKRLEEPIDIKKSKDVPHISCKQNKCILFNVDEEDKEGKNKFIFLVLKALFNFIEKEKRLPLLNSMEEAEKIVLKTKELYDDIRKSKNKIFEDIIDFDENIIKNISLYSSAEIPCMTSFLGGIVAQEIIKTTGKYVPVNQWLIFDFLKFLPKNKDKSNKIPLNRYTEQISIFGEEIIKELQNKKILLAGAGAVGCEMLKNLALLGIGANKEDEYITVVDHDIVEKSNLNRQFLFLKNSIGKSKVEAACEAAKKINKSIKFLPICEKFCLEKDKIFTNKFYMEKNIILISIDSQSGKEYLDKKATTFEIPMILGATLGPLAKAETFVPFETWCLNDKRIQSDNENSEINPSCTLRYFPKRIEDCIDWAKERFADLFIIPFQRLNNLNKNTNFINILKDISDEEKIFILNFAHVLKEYTIEKIIEYGLKFFIYYFTDWAKKIYEKYPLDSINEDGTAFWDINKIKPIEIKFDLKDDLCKNFILKYINIIAEILGNNEKILKNEEDLLKKIKQISTDENLEKLREQFNNEKYNLINFEQIILDTKKTLDLNNRINKYNILEFDKDDNKKGHLDFIHSISNLRAKIYKISNCDELKIFKYIGKIGPSTITSTATIVGFNILQMIRLIINNNENEKIIHSYQIDMSQNVYIMTNKINPIYKEDESIDELSGKKIKNIPKKFSCWDKFLIEGPKTIEEIINLFNEKYNVEITSILTSEGMDIYEKIVLKKNDFFIEDALKEKQKEDEKLKKNIEDVYFNEFNLDKSKLDYNYLFFKILGNFGKNYKANIPTIKYKIN